MSRLSPVRSLLGGALAAALMVSSLMLGGSFRPAQATPPTGADPTPVATTTAPAVEAPDQTSPVAPPTPFTAGTYPRVDGSTVTQPLGLAFQRAFTGEDVPDSAVVFSTTDKAYQNLIDGTTDLILVTSPSPDELNRAAAAGVELEVIPVVDEGFVFLTNADNPVTSLTVAQIRDIYSGKITNWKDVGGSDEPIIAYQRPQNSGSQTGMEDLVMKGTPMTDAPTLQIPTMSALVNVVSASFNGDAGSLGYSYYYYVTSMYGDLANDPQLAKIKLMAVDGVLPTPETIRSGEYPLTTAYYIVINKTAPADSPTRRLVDAMLSHDGQQVAADAGYVPVDPTIELPKPPEPDPNGLTSLDETYRVNPLTFTTSTEYLQGTRGCTQITRVTVSGLADTAVQDDINARFRAVQDGLAGLDPAQSCATQIWLDDNDNQVPEGTPGAHAGPVVLPAPYMLYTLSGSVGANFSNVLSLQTVLTIPPMPTSDPVVGTAALNVRLDTGADLVAPDVFTTTANVGGMIQLEAQAADPYCTEACGNAKAMQYRANPDQPFSFTASSATVMGVQIPFTSYWPQVAIFKTFAGLPVAYTAASPADCPVIATVWSDIVQACVPTAATIGDAGTTGSVPASGGSIDVPLPVTAADDWWALSGDCASWNATLLSGRPITPPGDVTPSSGTGPGSVTKTLGANLSRSAQSLKVCVVAIDQATRWASLKEVTVPQDGAPATWTLTTDPRDGATVTTAQPTFSGVLSDAGGAPVTQADVYVQMLAWPYATVCDAQTDDQGAWSCAAGILLPNGPVALKVSTDDWQNMGTVLLWAETDITLIVAVPDAPGVPVITAPISGQTVYAGSGGYVVAGTADPGATVLVNDGSCTATADAGGNWQCYVTAWVRATVQDATVTAYVARADSRSAASAPVAFKVNTRAGYGLSVTSNNAPADGHSANTVTVSVVSTRDANGNPVDDSMLTRMFTATVTSGDPAVTILTPSVDSVNGSATLRLAATRPGTHVVQVQVNGQIVPLINSAGGVVLPTTLDFVPGPDPKASSLALSASEMAVAYTEYCTNVPHGDTPASITATATVIGANGKPVAGVPVSFTGGRTLVVPAAPVTTDGNGVAGVTVTRNQAIGVSFLSPAADLSPQVHATVLVNGNPVEIGGSPKTVTLGVQPEIISPPPPHLEVLATVDVGKTVTTPSAVLADGSQSYTARVAFSDSCGPTPDVPVTFSVSGSATPSSVSVTSGPDGVARFTFTDTKAESVTVIATRAGNEIGHVVVAFTAPPVTRTATLSVTGGPSIIIGTGVCPDPTTPKASTVTASVTVMDGTVPAVGVRVLFTADAPGIVVSSDASPVTDEHGVASVEVSVDVANASSSMMVRASVPGVATISPVSVPVRGTGALPPPTVSLSVSPDGPVPADGTSAYMATVTVTDSCGLARAGAPVRVTVDGHANATSDPAVTDATGVATAVITDATAETVTISASAYVDGAWNPQPSVLHPVPAVQRSVTFSAVPPVTVPVVTGANATLIAGTTAPAVTNVLVTYPVADGGTKTVTVPVTGGTWTLDTPVDAVGGTVSVVGVDVAGRRSAAVTLPLDITAPAAPGGTQVSGSQASGTGEQGSRIVLVDHATGALVGEAIVDATGHWTAMLTAPFAPGRTLEVTAYDTATNASRTLSVTTQVPPSPATATVAVGQSGRTFTFTGSGFVAGESVTATVYSTPVALGSRTADAAGTVVFVWTAPADFPAGAHEVVMTGASGGTGTVRMAFAVPTVTGGTSSTTTTTATGSQSRTGGSVGAGASLMPGGLAALALLLGAGAVWARRRWRAVPVRVR